MKADRWRQVDKMFHDLIEQTPQERASFLDRIGADDPLLKKEVEDLIQAYERSGSFLDSPAPVSASGSLIGRALGSYELKALLGSGGMGEVYRARDSKLKRDVAIKLLPATFSRDPDRVARFQREAEVLASLNHPNIAAIYDLAVSGDSRFLVLELVEGETLGELLARRPIPMTEALEIAKQMAEALEAAHERGIIHRDLKPANVKITPQGRVKVLDFGLAKVLEVAAGASVSPSKPPTMLTAASGMVMGTAAYMSPEQASGEDTDRQTDVWAFGCVLYEMLTSRRLFDGRNSAEILASVLKSTPDLDRLPAETPVSIRRLLRRCLQRDRNERLRDIGDARLEIADVLAGPPSNERSPVGQVRSWERPAWILTALITLLAGAGVVWVFRPATQPAERRLELSMPPSALMESAISPDGAKVAFVANNDGLPQLWIRSLNAESSVPLPGTEFAQSPFWSPDSQSVAFISENQLKVTGILAGAPRVLAAAGFAGFGGGAWSKDGTILFCSGPLYSIGANGGERTAVTHLEGTQPGHAFPTFLPDGKHFLYHAAVAEGSGPSGVYLGGLGSPLQRRLLDADTKAVYVPGYVLFGRKSTLFAQGFDVGSLTLRGEPFPLVERIDGEVGLLAVSASNDGTIVYRKAPGGIGQRQFGWFDRQGNELQKVGAPVDGTAGTLSSSGNLVAFNQNAAGNTDVWLLDVEHGTVDPFTSDPATDMFPAFSHDGRYIAYSSNRKGKGFDLYRSPVSTPADAYLLMPGASATDWSRDGRNLLITMRESPRSIWVLPFDEKGIPGSPRPIVKTGAGEAVAHFSPDSKWIVYQGNRSGQWEIYVQAFPDSQSQATRISDAGGKQARWSADGKEIFYVARNGRLTVVPVQVSPKSGFTKGKPMELFAARIGFNDNINLQFYIVSPDAQKFLIATLADRPSPPMTVLLNWKGKGLDSRK